MALWRAIAYPEGVHHRFLDDPFVSGEIDDAISDLAAGLRAEERGWLRVQLACLLEEEPELRELLRGAHPRAVDRSGEQRLRLGLDDEGLDDEDAANDAARG